MAHFRRDWRRRALAIACFCVGSSLVVLSGCDVLGTEQRVVADRVVRAVRDLREAQNEDKKQRLQLLRTIECGAKDVCEFKDECVAAYELYVRGFDAVRAVKHSLGGDAGQGEAERAAELLESAEKDVEAGRARATKCSELEAKIAARYRLR